MNLCAPRVRNPHSRAKSKGDSVSDSAMDTLFATFRMRALRGSIGGILGASLLAAWMAENGGFPVVASMVGGSSALLDLLMFLGMSAAIGAIFGLLFARLATSVALRFCAFERSSTSGP